MYVSQGDNRALKYVVFLGPIQFTADFRPKEEKTLWRRGADHIRVISRISPSSLLVEAEELSCSSCNNSAAELLKHSQANLELMLRCVTRGG